MLICQARILLPDGNLFLGDVRINDGKIVQIAPENSLDETEKVIDAAGLTLLPGVIDL
nr:hypothetical protein [Myxosarcina sp. GI1]